VESPAASGDGPPGVPVIGYATFSGRALEECDDDLAGQAKVIARACEQRGLALVEVVREPLTGQGPLRAGLADGRQGLRYALGRIAAGEARGLVVPGLRRLTRSPGELGTIVDWVTRRGARLVAVAQGLDTAEREGRVAAKLIIEVSRWERERLGEDALWSVSPLLVPSAGACDAGDDGVENHGDVAVPVTFS
jgi:DNA invertase Pin-like site-specific DNA recombinase